MNSDLNFGRNWDFKCKKQSQPASHAWFAIRTQNILDKSKKAFSERKKTLKYHLTFTKRDFKIFKEVEKYLKVIEIARGILRRFLISSTISFELFKFYKKFSPSAFSFFGLRKILFQIAWKTSGRGEMWVVESEIVGLQIDVEAGVGVK